MEREREEDGDAIYELVVVDSKERRSSSPQSTFRANVSSSRIITQTIMSGINRFAANELRYTHNKKLIIHSGTKTTLCTIWLEDRGRSGRSVRIVALESLAKSKGIFLGLYLPNKNRSRG